MYLIFCENNTVFYTGTLKICKNVAEGTSYRFDAIDPASLALF